MPAGGSLRHSDLLVRHAQELRNPRQFRTDLAIQFRIEDRNGEITRPYGGVWDSRLARYVGIFDGEEWIGEQPQTIHTIPVGAQNIDYIQDFETELLLAVGGRRSGKTRGSLAPKCLIMLLLFPGLAGGVLSPTYRQSRNVWRALTAITPPHWWRTLHKTEHTMELITGARVQLLSADRDDSARSEGVAWGAYDERQDISEEAAANAMLSTSEGGAFPQIFETATIKPCLRAHWEKVKAEGKIYSMRSRGNPFIDHKIFDIAEKFLDRATVQRELEGEWPDLVGRCYYPYIDDSHCVQYPREFMRDVTQTFTSEKFDKQAPWLIGVDPPRHAVLCKIYHDETLHVVHEVCIGSDGRDGDVRNLALAIRALCGNSKETPGIVIFDPHESHWDNDVRKYFKQEMFRVAHMRQVEVEYRLTAVRSRLEKNKLLIDPSCRHLREALNEQTYVNNKPDKATLSRISAHMSMDHIVDALGYLVYKIWPAKLDYAALEKKAA